MFFETIPPLTAAMDSAPLPGDVVVTQRAAALLRAYLSDNDCGHYRVFNCSGNELYDVDWYLAQLGEPAARWEPTAPFINGGDAIADVDHDADTPVRLHDGGILRLARHEVVIGRWYWMNHEGGLSTLTLFAAHTPAHFARLQDEVLRHRRGGNRAVWQIVRGYATQDGPRPPRVEGDELLLPEPLRRRVEIDIVRFFDAEVAALYRSMRVPYRRGVLLHGPPGNGKTSLIRHVGVRLPETPVLILRPAASFNSDHLESVIRRWTREAPAILVIEDLNWLLEQVNVSMFLNLIDGVDSGGVTGGLLLMATTNHPDQLDPAINNRPGRFDVVIEIAPPDRALRLEFFRRHVREADAAVLTKLADQTDRLSFAHLQEVLRLSGLTAIHAGRTARSADDLSSAVATVRETYESAIRGFPQKPEVPFGLLHLRKEKR